MNKRRLSRMEFSEWIIFILLISLLIGLFYHSMIFKNLCFQIIESTLVIFFWISLITIRRVISRLKIDMGLIKAYGENFGFNSIMLINMAIGVIWVILGFLTIVDKYGFIFKLTLGLGFIIIGLSKSHRYYLKITDKNINKLDFDFMEIKAIKLITFSSEKIILKTNKRSMEIFHANVKEHERHLIINVFEDIRLKNNLA